MGEGRIEDYVYRRSCPKCHYRPPDIGYYPNEIEAFMCGSCAESHCSPEKMIERDLKVVKNMLNDTHQNYSTTSKNTVEYGRHNPEKVSRTDRAPLFESESLRQLLQKWMANPHSF